MNRKRAKKIVCRPAVVKNSKANPEGLEKRDYQCVANVQMDCTSRSVYWRPAM